MLGGARAGSGDLYVNGIVTIEVQVFKICADSDEVSDSFDMEQIFDEWYAAWIEEEKRRRMVGVGQRDERTDCRHVRA